MFAWIARGLLLIAGVITSWIVAKDAENFGIVQMTVALLLFVLAVFVIALWPRAWTRKLSGQR